MKRNNYIYYDVTPDGEDNRDNCVTRAITLASGLPYWKVRKLLVRNSAENDCEELACDCYSNLIENVFGFEPIFVPYGITVGEFAKTHQQGVYLVRMDGHISVIMNGFSYDIFDCTGEIVTNAWRVE